MQQSPSHYVGEELDIFRHARRWKAYWSRHVRPWIRGDVVEVGAGIGANTAGLQTPGVRSWLCLEPDPELAERLRAATVSLAHCSVAVGTAPSLPRASYDTVLYIDVLEHIADDKAELAHAAELLRPAGNLIVLSPAHQSLYSPFDAAIGHYRRYNRRSLAACTPPGCRIEWLGYLDSVGVATSFANRALLKQSQPTLQQILFWDRFIVPVSAAVDRRLGYRFGKSVLGIWTRRDQLHVERAEGHSQHLKK